MVPHSAEASPGVLNSWKEIAAYLDRDVRTVMRWEQTRGMPVHRLPGGHKSAVYAIKSELEAWRRGRKLTLLDFPNEELSSKPPALERSQPKRRSWITLAAAACVVLAAAGVLLIRTAKSPQARTLPAAMNRLTWDHATQWPSLSADGKLLAYASDRGGKFDIYIRHLGGHESIQVSHSDADNIQPALSPDGSRIIFRSDRDGGGIYEVETLGGTERRIADRGMSPRFSPNGASILYLVRNAFTGRAKMFLTDREGGPSRPFQPEFEVPPIGTVFTPPMWSPEGRHVLFEGIRAGDNRSRGLWVAPVGGGPAVRLEGMKPVERGKIRVYSAWSGNALYYVEGTSVHGAPLIRVPVKENPWRLAGEPERLTSPAMVCGLGSVSADGRLAITVAGSFANKIWSAPFREGAAGVTGPVRVETPENFNQMMMSVASNGSRLAYLGYPEVGHLEIRIMDLATRRLATVPLSSENRSPFVHLSSDGSRLGYRDFVGGKLLSYDVPAANPLPGRAACDGCSILGYFSKSSDILTTQGGGLVRQNIATGERIQLVNGPAADPALSRDDQWLAFVAPKPDGSAGLFAAKMSSRPAPSEEWIAVAEDANFIGSPRWSTHNWLYYVSNRDSFSCVWAQPFDPATRSFGKPIHVLHGAGTPSMKVSPGRSIGVTPDRLYVMMAAAESNIWTMKVESR